LFTVFALQKKMQMARWTWCLPPEAVMNRCLLLLSLILPGFVDKAAISFKGNNHIILIQVRNMSWGCETALVSSSYFLNCSPKVFTLKTSSQLGNISKMIHSGLEI
jgi:hypothetical protein